MSTPPIQRHNHVTFSQISFVVESTDSSVSGDTSANETPASTLQTDVSIAAAKEKQSGDSKSLLRLAIPIPSGEDTESPPPSHQRRRRPTSEMRVLSSSIPPSCLTGGSFTRRSSEGNTSLERPIRMLDVLDTPRPYPESSPIPIDVPSVSPSSSSSSISSSPRAREGSPRGGSWPPFLNLFSNSKGSPGSRSSPRLAEDSVVCRPGCSSSSSSLDQTPIQIPDKEWKYPKKLASARLFNADKAVAALLLLVKRYPNAWEEILEGMFRICTAASSKRREHRWPEFIMKLFLNTDRNPDAAFFRLLLKRTHTDENQMAHYIFGKCPKTPKHPMNWMILLHLDQFCVSEERNPVPNARICSGFPFALSLFNCYVRSLAEPTLRALEGTEGTTNSYELATHILQKMLVMQYPEDLKQHFVLLREKFKRFTFDEDLLRQRIGSIFLEGVIYPHLRQTLGLKENVLIPMMEHMQALLVCRTEDFEHPGAAQKDPEGALELFYREWADPFRAHVDQLSLGIYLETPDGTRHLEEFLKMEFDFERIDVSKVVTYLTRYLAENPKYERIILILFLKFYHAAPASHQEDWNSLIIDLACHNKSIEFFNTFYAEIKTHVDTKSLEKPLIDKLAKMDPINVMFVVRAHIAHSLKGQNLETLLRTSSFTTFLLSQYGEFLAHTQLAQLYQYLDTRALIPLSTHLNLARSSGSPDDHSILFGCAEGAVSELFSRQFSDSFKTLIFIYRQELRTFLIGLPDLNPDLKEDQEERGRCLNEISRLEASYMRSLFFLYMINPHLIKKYAATDKRQASIAISRVLQSLANGVQAPQQDDLYAVKMHEFYERSLYAIDAFILQLSADISPASCSSAHT